MKRLQASFASISALLLLTGNRGLGGCSSAKEPSPAPVVQQDPAPAQQEQGAQAQEAQEMQLPEVNLTADGLDELQAPVALYPDPVLAVMLQAAVDPQEVMDGGNWLVLDQNKSLKEAALDEASKKAGFTQNNGQQVAELKPAGPKVIYVPQCNPDRVFQTTSTTTTRPDGTTTTTTTTTGPAPTHVARSSHSWRRELGN
jgi:hypothetical protein